jgi:DNA-binding NarL/FixJ family response regulator
MRVLRQEMLNDTFLDDEPLPKILVIDDDPLFNAKVRKISRQKKLPVTTCASLHELGSLLDLRRFDVVIVDYFLDNLKEFLTGTDLARVFEAIPMVLVSNNDHPLMNHDPWPSSIRKFVNKKAGVEAILTAAIQIKEEAHA